jgi:hypothetical protein
MTPTVSKSFMWKTTKELIERKKRAKKIKDFYLTKNSQSNLRLGVSFNSS